MSRPPHLPIRGVAAIVKAARLLHAGEKLVWLELLELDQGGEDGAWLGAGSLAERLGVSRETIEVHRRELRFLGLLESRQPAGRRTASWYPVLPSACLPTNARRRPDVDEVARLAKALDAYIVTRRNGGAQNANEVGEVAQHTTPLTAQPTTPVQPKPAHPFYEAALPEDADSARGERGVRGESRETPDSTSSPQPSIEHTPPSSEAGERGEAGEKGGENVAQSERERGETGGTAEADRKLEELKARWFARTKAAQPVGHLLPAVLRATVHTRTPEAAE